MSLFGKIFGESKNKSQSGPPSQQMPFLQNMWQNAQNMAQQQSQYFGSPVGGQNLPTQTAQGLVNQGQGYQTALAGAGSQLAPFAQQGYGGLQMAGLQDQLQQQLGQSFGQIRDAGQMAGGFGGAGMGIQQNQAIQDAGRTLFQGAGGIMQSDLMRQQQAAGQMGQQNLIGNQAAASNLSGLYDLGINAPMQSLFQPFVTQGGINQGYNSSSSRGSGTPGVLGAVSGNFNFGKP